MPIGTDRVQVQKEETTAGGGDPFDVGPYGGPVPIEPQQDAIESAGIYLQDSVDRDEEVYVCRDQGKLCFRDTENTTPISLTDINTGALPAPISPCALLYSIDGVMWSQIVPLVGNGILVNSAGEIMYKG